MATTTAKTPSKFQVELQNAISGLTTAGSATPNTLSIGGSSFTAAEVIAKLKAYLVLFVAVTQTKQAYVAAVAARMAAQAAAHLFYANLVTTLKQVIGANNQAQLAVYGILPPKVRATPSVETKTIAKAKAKATRAARGTLGKKQKQAITSAPQPSVQVFGADGKPFDGSAPAVVSSPATAPSATPVASPAGSGTPTTGH